MADTNIKLVVSGQNNTRATFEQVTRDLERVRAELAKPFEGPDADAVRKSLESRAKGLERVQYATSIRGQVEDRLSTSSIDARAFKIADRTALEQSRRDRRAQAIRDERATESLRRDLPLTATDLIREQNERFRATARRDIRSQAVTTDKRGIGDAISGASAGLSKVARGLVGIEAAYKGIEMVSGTVKLVNAHITGGYNDQVAAATSLREVIKSLPIFGEKIVRIGEAVNRQTFGRLTGETAYLDKMKKVTAEQEKQIARMQTIAERQEKRNTEAALVANRVGSASDPFATASQQLRGKIAADKKELEETLKQFRDPKGKLNATGQEFADQGRKRILNDEKALARLENEERLKGRQAVVDRETESADRLARLRRSARDSELAAEGRFLELRIAQINDLAQAEREAAEKRFAEETANGTTHGKEYIAAETRRLQEIAAIDTRANAEARAAQVQSARERMRIEQDNEQRIRAAESRNVVTTLQINGNRFAAEQALRDSAHRDRIEQINRHYDDEIRADARNAETLNQQRRRELEAANTEKSLADKQSMHEDSFRVRGPAPFQGESRLLTGIGASEDRMLKPVESTAANTAKIHKQQNETNRLLTKIAASLEANDNNVLDRL